ncbi:MAG TPA: fused MFS/spermidine synthase [Candidatus Polarisedimenticolaceae bacterium]
MTNPTSIQRLTTSFAALFVLSGMAGLIYQVVWSRSLVPVFGVTAFAVSTVLVSFMGGMALGAALLGKRADRAKRPLRMFAMLEAGIGLYALALPLLLRLVDLAYSAVFTSIDSFFLKSLVRFVFSLSLLLVPTVLMGATLPALGQGLLRRKETLGEGIGLLYFVNTLGAAFGTWIAGFVLLPYLGLTRTTAVAFVLNATVAIVAWRLDAARGEEEAAESAAISVEPSEPACDPPSWPLWVAFGSGLCALAFEVAWFRVLVLVFGSTVYSFSAMLSVFLLGLAVGSLLMGRWVDRAAHPARMLALTQGAVALSALLGCLFVNAMPGFFLSVLSSVGIDFSGMNLTKMVLSFLTLLLPGLAFGANFPVAVRLADLGGVGTGTRIGRVYAWNTVGAILGSFGAGFVLLPWIGMEWTLRGVIVLAALLAFGSVVAERGALVMRWAAPMGLALVTIVALALTGPRWDRTLLGAGVYFEPEKFLGPDGPSTAGVVADYTLKTYTEGYNETILSFESPVGKFITVNGSTTASDHFEDMFSQRMLGHLPMALHPGKVGKAAIVGLGAGVTAGAAALYPIDELVGLEIERGVFEASRFFSDVNHGLLDNPKLRVVIDDGRNFLKLTSERFDVISSAPNFPSLTGSGGLYSRDFFEVAKSRLTPGGTMCQFAPVWRMRSEDVKTIAGSFADVFPHVRVFSTGVSLVMLGRMEPFPPVDMDEIARRVSDPAVKESLERIGVRGPVELLSFFQMDEHGLRRWAGDAPRNTDDRPRTEFFAPRAVFDSTVAPNLAELRTFRASPEERATALGLSGDWAPSFVALASAYDAVLEGEIAFHEGKSGDAVRILAPVAVSGHRYARYLLADWHEKLGHKFQGEGKVAEAKAEFERVVALEPDRLEGLVGVGYLEMFGGDLAKADALLSYAVALYPRSGGALWRLGVLRAMQGRGAEGLALVQKAIEAQPRLSKPYAILGGMLLEGGNAAGAVEALEQAVRLGDEGTETLAGLAEARKRAGR